MSNLDARLRGIAFAVDEGYRNDIFEAANIVQRVAAIERENAALLVLIERLAEQQAMPDDWWKAELAKIGTPSEMMRRKGYEHLTVQQFYDGKPPREDSEDHEDNERQRIEDGMKDQRGDFYP